MPNFSSRYASFIGGGQQRPSSQAQWGRHPSGSSGPTNGGTGMIGGVPSGPHPAAPPPQGVTQGRPPQQDPYQQIQQNILNGNGTTGDYMKLWRQQNGSTLPAASPPPGGLSVPQYPPSMIAPRDPRLGVPTMPQSPPRIPYSGFRNNRLRSMFGMRPGGMQRPPSRYKWNPVQGLPINAATYQNYILGGGQ